MALSFIVSLIAYHFCKSKTFMLFICPDYDCSLQPESFSQIISAMRFSALPPTSEDSNDFFQMLAISPFINHSTNWHCPVKVLEQHHKITHTKDILYVTFLMPILIKANLYMISDYLWKCLNLNFWHFKQVSDLAIKVTDNSLYIVFNRSKQNSRLFGTYLSPNPSITF